MRRRDCKLLPHIKEPLFGFNYQSAQIIPWAINRFNVSDVWRKSTGDNVLVAVIDTGCDPDHPDIKDNIATGFNAIHNNQNFADRNGHGTHVAGTIAAINNSLGIVGISPNTKIMPVKALNDNGSGSNDDVANAILYAVANEADIITMSLGSDYPSVKIEKALVQAEKANVSVFCAAGNSGIKHDINFPARYSQTICIGAIGQDLDLSEFSCSGDTLDFLAPGENIISCVPGNNYASMSGTSMATPFAVGCYALYLSFLRNTIDKNLKLTKADIVKHFMKSALKLNNKEYSGLRRYEGYGIISPSV